MWTIEREGSRITGFFQDRESADRAAASMAGFDGLSVIECEYIVMCNGGIVDYAYDVKGAVNIVIVRIKEYVVDAFFMGLDVNMRFGHDRLWLDIETNNMAYGPENYCIFDANGHRVVMEEIYQ